MKKWSKSEINADDHKKLITHSHSVIDNGDLNDIWVWDVMKSVTDSDIVENVLKF